MIPSLTPPVAGAPAASAFLDSNSDTLSKPLIPSVSSAVTCTISDPPGQTRCAPDTERTLTRPSGVERSRARRQRFSEHSDSTTSSTLIIPSSSPPETTQRPRARTVSTPETKSFKPSATSAGRPDREEAETTQRSRDSCCIQRLLGSLKDAAAPTDCWEEKGFNFLKCF